MYKHHQYYEKKFAIKVDVIRRFAVLWFMFQMLFGTRKQAEEAARTNLDYALHGLYGYRVVVHPWKWLKFGWMPGFNEGW